MPDAECEAKIGRPVEAQASQAADELRAIVDNAPAFLWSELPDGYCDFLNQRWLTYFDLSLQDAQGDGWATLLHPDDAVHHLESWQKSVSTGVPFETEARCKPILGTRAGQPLHGGQPVFRASRFGRRLSAGSAAGRASCGARLQALIKSMI